jgi:2-dehydropantoate 2-reductase
VFDGIKGSQIMTGKRVAVLGAGANGASIGADLARFGEDVVLIEQWPANVEAMRARGVIVNMPGESLQVPVRTMHLCELATLREPFDIVLVLVKAYDTRWAVQLIEPYLAPDALVVGVQNGMTIDAITDVVGMERSMGCVIEITSMMFDPGVVERHSPASRSWFAVGSVGDATAGREEEVASLLRHSGSVSVVENIRATKWMKIVSNATTLATTAILGLPMVEAATIPRMRELMIRSGQEALDATIGIGNPVLPIFGLDDSDVGRPETLVVTLLETLLEGFVMPNSITTILQDWMKDRRSEVDDINGLVVSTQSALGRPAPVNAAVIDLAHLIERGTIEPGIDNLALLLESADFGS